MVNDHAVKLALHLAHRMAHLGISRANVGVALSGGADSLSLALALSWWSGASGHVPGDAATAMNGIVGAQPTELEQHLSASQYLQYLVKPRRTKQLKLHSQPSTEKPRVAAFCVDHQLRPESSGECQQAATQASAMGLEAQIIKLQWPVMPATGHMMEQASIMRYQLLHQACQARQVSVLLTGHHAGDQAETFMMRASRASGISGLAGIAEASWSSLDTDHPLLLVRPFLELPKSQLEAACIEQGLTWADDPTNRNTVYLRNHMRALLSKPLPQLQSHQPTPQQSSAFSLSAASTGPTSQHPQDHQQHRHDETQNLAQQAAVQEEVLCEPPSYEASAAITPAVLRVQRRCAAAHDTLSHQAKALLQSSLQLDDSAQQGQQSRQHRRSTSQTVTEWRLAVKPFAEARPDVALHALSAAMQARSGRSKQPKLSTVRNLMKRVATGRLRGSYVANDCIVSPALLSQGEYMTVQPLPSPSVPHTVRRHQ